MSPLGGRHVWTQSRRFGTSRYGSRLKETTTVRLEIRFLCLAESEFFHKIDVFRHVCEKLQVVKSGVFVTFGEDTLDFTSKGPTCKNYQLNKK
jgi:hypothetical protein